MPYKINPVKIIFIAQKLPIWQSGGTQRVLLVLESHRGFLLGIWEFNLIASIIGRDFSRIAVNIVVTENTHYL